MSFSIDQKFKDHFRDLKQVFLYVIDECNLSCVQCLYKPSLTFHLNHKEIPIQEAIKLVSSFKKMGAIKLTILGGEPTLYGASHNNEQLSLLIREAKKLGYEHVRMDTNGVFEGTILAKPHIDRLDEIAFSLDGFSSEINDPIRGIGTFNKCVSNIRRAVGSGYNVSITSCIHRNLLRRDTNDGRLGLDKMIRFGESLGVKTVNFHDLFKVGVPMDSWSGDLAPPIKEWINAYKEIRNNIDRGNYGVSVRLPLCFITRQEFDSNPEYYGYCPAKLGERVMVHPDGMIRICSNLICTPYCVGRFHSGKIMWEESLTNELRSHKLDEFTPCTNRSKRDFGDLVPLCFSLKPDQNEVIWKNLNWESRRKRPIKWSG